ncbi:hypothetical protein [Streptacidiphilus cavernicola]|uniref:DUF3618 domain-containing protein n=1 Tax=Streptacidiphilus cavernicola TaxID=3342716 RepID=A0ABV6VY36_9ACTN
MPDEVTPGELDRRIRDHELRTDRVHAELDNRITRVATEAVQADVHDRIERDRDKELAALTNRVTKLEERPGLTWGRVVAGAAVVIALLALVFQAYSTVKGAQ